MRVLKKINWAKIRNVCLILLCLDLCCYTGIVFAQDTSTNLGTLASNVLESFSQIGHLMIAVAYLAGFGFVIAGIFKFKQHKDNPTQIPMGTPIAMVMIGIGLIFLPSFVGPAGSTIFGTKGELKAGGFAGSGVEIIPGGKETKGPA